MTDEEIESNWLKVMKEASWAWQDTMDSLCKLAPLFYHIAKLKEEARANYDESQNKEYEIRLAMIKSHAEIDTLLKAYSNYTFARNSLDRHLSADRINRAASVQKE